MSRPSPRLARFHVQCWIAQDYVALVSSCCYYAVSRLLCFEVFPPMSTSAVQPDLSLAPLPTPETVSEVGVNKSLLEDLALKTIYVTAPGSLVELSTTMRLHYRVVDEIFRRLRGEQMVEVTGMTGNTRQIALTNAGRNRALDLLA